MLCDHSDMSDRLSRQMSFQNLFSFMHTGVPKSGLFLRNRASTWTVLGAFLLCLIGKWKVLWLEPQIETKIVPMMSLRHAHETITFTKTSERSYVSVCRKVDVHNDTSYYHFTIMGLTKSRASYSFYLHSLIAAKWAHEPKIQGYRFNVVNACIRHRFEKYCCLWWFYRNAVFDFGL